MTLPLFSQGPLTDAPSPELRPYQERAVRLARMHVDAGKKRILLAAPTGSGKMCILASIIRSSTVPVLFVCHRMELVDQCCNEIARVGIHHVGVLRGDDERENASASIQVASIQTLIRRPKPKAGLVIIDECHRSLSDSFTELLKHYQDSIILGFTASPCRSDGRPMGDVYEVLETVASYSELLKRPEWLLEPDVFSAPIAPNLSTLQVKHGDFEETPLGEVMSQKHLVGNLLDHWLALADKYPVFVNGMRAPGQTTTGERRRTFIFAVNIQHSKLICERFAAAGIRIAHLDGTTPEDERRAVLNAIRKGEIECVSSCNVLLEGVDAPEVKCVVHARPTWSLVLWLQSCGRILRPWKLPNGDWARPLILDHADNWSRHGPPHEDRVWSLTNVVGRKSTAKPYKMCRACFAYVMLSAKVCTYCKYVFTSEEMRELPKETPDQLVYRSTATEDVRREFFNRIASTARLRAFKPGYAAAKYREHYGEWPPRAWSDEVKMAFECDPLWQAALEQRTKAKEREESAWDAAIEDPLPAPAETVDFDVYDDGEETFSAWTRREFSQ